MPGNFAFFPGPGAVSARFNAASSSSPAKGLIRVFGRPRPRNPFRLARSARPVMLRMGSRGFKCRKVRTSDWAVHARHHHIRDDRSDFALMLGKERHGFRAFVGGHHPVTMLFQRALESRWRTAASSSTTKISSPCGARRQVFSIGCDRGYRFRQAGRKSSKVVPCPTRLFTRTKPPWPRTMPSTVASPRPVPLPISLVVKNGSKMRSRLFGRDAHAGVGHAHAHISAGLGLGRQGGEMLRRAVRFSAASVSVPPSGMASRALTHRFMSA